jgi:thioredoxin 1
VDGPRFDAEVLAASGRVVVLFWAAWSSPDRMLQLWLRDHAADWPEVKFFILDVEQSPEVANRFRYSAMPTTLAFEGGELVGRLDGLPGYYDDSWVQEFDRLTGRAVTPPAG